MAIQYAPKTKPKRKKTGGRKKSADPYVVVTLRIPMSVKERLKPDWRKRVAEFLASPYG